MSIPTLLEELIKDFPNDIKLKIRECIDRTRIRNPDDPIYELMIVLGIWAKYYESIPQKVRDTGNAVDAQNKQMLASLDARLKLLQTLAQAVQKAVDQLDGAPKAIVDKFPVETLAKSIADKLDAKFSALPLTKLEQSVVSLQNKLDAFIGQEEKPQEKKPATGAKKMEADIKRLDESADKLANMKFPRAPSPLRDFQIGFTTFVITAAVCWYSWYRPSMQDVKALMQNEVFMSKYIMSGSVNGKPYILVPHQNLISRDDRPSGDLVIYLKERPEKPDADQEKSRPGYSEQH